MVFRWNPRAYGILGLYVVKWMLLAGAMALVVGSTCALFLRALDVATETRWNHPALLYFLPLAGVLIVLLYRGVGRSTEGGNNLILERIHAPGGGVPSRMAPLILFSTLATHLFGGSAGREGTAVQMGGSLAASFGRLLRLSPEDTRTLLMAGVAAGFGGVFGTPIAGAVFAMEVLVIGRMNYESLVPCLIAAVVADWACGAWGARHEDYHFLIRAAPHLDGVLMGKVVVAAAAFGLASLVFAETTHGFQKVFEKVLPFPLLRPVAGAFLLIGMVHLLGTRDYLGLGVHAPPGDPGAVTILSSFLPDGAHPWSWWWKLLFTAVTLGCGFKGGEVTPLFFIGAALGNVLAGLLGGPVDLFAGLGFVAVFAGAANTPLACTIMGIELFGAENAVYFAAACFFAYLFSGHSGIYLSQRIGTPKAALSLPPDASLREARELRPGLSSFLRRVAPKFFD